MAYARRRDARAQAQAQVQAQTVSMLASQEVQMMIEKARSEGYAIGFQHGLATRGARHHGRQI